MADCQTSQQMAQRQLCQREKSECYTGLEWADITEHPFRAAVQGLWQNLVLLG